MPWSLVRSASTRRSGRRIFQRCGWSVSLRPFTEPRRPRGCTGNPTTRVSVVVPTYRRPERLGLCLDGLALQSRIPDEIVVPRRSDDDAARELLSQRSDHGLKVVEVAEPGVLAAMTAALCQTTGSIVAFTDDDAVPRRDWLE